MHLSFGKREPRLTRLALAVTTAVLGFGASSAMAQTFCPPNCAAPGGEQKQMVRKSHMTLQGRESYQPNVIQHPTSGHWLLFVGTHSGTHVNDIPGTPGFGTTQPNGTNIIDVQNVNAPVPLFHIPGTTGGVSGGTPSGQSQMVRMCQGRDLPGATGNNSRLYMMRNTGTTYETYDVTTPSAPIFLADTRSFGALAVTHKLWWECASGVVYAPGSRTADCFRQDQSTLVIDWKNPRSAPNLIRTHTLPGGQQLPNSGTGPVPTSLHGPISAFEHPDGTNLLTRGTVLPTATVAGDVIKNRVYASWGVGGDGVHQTIDRQKLLPASSTGGSQAPVISYGGTWNGLGNGCTGLPALASCPTLVGGLSNPTNAQLLESVVTLYDMSPDQGGHTSFPVFGMEPESYQSYSFATKRDILVLASEATSNLCNEEPHWSFLVDITVENSKANVTAQGVTYSARPDQWQGPMGLSTLATDPRDGANYSRGNYCTRGSRFGTHSSEENFRNPFYGRCTAVALFTGGVRVWDIREPQAPKEIAFFVGGDGYPNYMTNNLEIDDRGNIYPVDRIGAGGDILQLTGNAKNICLGL